MTEDEIDRLIDAQPREGAILGGCFWLLFGGVSGTALSALFGLWVFEWDGWWKLAIAITVTAAGYGAVSGWLWGDEKKRRGVL